MGRPLLFRGHQDAAWQLRTTLERRLTGTQCSWNDYGFLVRSTLPQVQTLSNRTWDKSDIKELQDWGKAYDHRLNSPPLYAYFVYLRHHGFPSPLLDWSRSPYVAAFFAFRTHSDKPVAIYSFLDAPGAKLHSSRYPEIMQMGAYIHSHPRHVLQQCEYTMSSHFASNEWTFAPHEKVFDLDDRQQDLIWKFTLPASERLSVLKKLDAYNLHAYSLFQTEDALLETTALREIEFRKRFE